MKNVGVTGYLLNFVINFLQHREIRVRVNGILSDKYKISNGVPQGSPLSATLFLIAINEISSVISKPIQKCLFADDLTLLCKGINIQSTTDCIQETLNKLTNWAQNTGFKFSESKSEYIIFSRIRRPDSRNMKLSLGTKEIRRSNQIKILGLTFDQRLTWGTHIRTLKGECLRRMNLIKSIASCNWGASNDVIMNTYKAFIRSKMDYGAIIYDSAKQTILKSLETIHTSALRLALGAFRTSPINSILAESHEYPLRIRRIKLCLSFATRAASNPDNPVSLNVFSNRNSDKFAKRPTLPKPFYEHIN